MWMCLKCVITICSIAHVERVAKQPLELGQEYMKEALGLMTKASQKAKVIASIDDAVAKASLPGITNFSNFMSERWDELRVLTVVKKLNTATVDGESSPSAQTQAPSGIAATL